MNKIELVAGQWYLNRNGAIVYAAFDKRNIMPGIKHDYPIVALDTEGVEISFTSDGVFYKGSLGSSGQDLVEHLPDCTGFDYVKPTAKEPGNPTTPDTLLKIDEIAGKCYLIAGDKVLGLIVNSSLNSSREVLGQEDDPNTYAVRHSGSPVVSNTLTIEYETVH